MRHPDPLTAALFAILTLTLTLVLPGCGGTDDSTYTDDDTDATPSSTNTMALSPKALIPTTPDRLQPALRSDIDSAIITKLIEKHTQLGRTYLDRDETLAVENTPESLKAFLAAVQNDFASPEQTELIIHAATGEELAAYTPGTPAQNFAGGAQAVAQEILNPTTTFYTISYVEPGQNRGMRLDLLYWDGQQWSILIKPWRGVLD